MDAETKAKFLSCSPTELRELYEKEPGTFDRLAKEAISRACIGKTPEQTLKLRQMQWTIDAQLRVAKSPVERMHIMEHIFYGQVYGDEGQLVKLITACYKLLGAVNGIAQFAGKKPELRLVKQQTLRRVSS